MTFTKYWVPLSYAYVGLNYYLQYYLTKKIVNHFFLR